MRVIRPLHAAILVGDLERSAYFYGEVLGLTPARDRALGFAGLWYELGDFQIHLIVSAQICPDPVDAQRLGRNRHLALAVDDLLAARDRLEKAGFPVQASASGRAAFFVQDPDGNILELGEVPYGK